MADDFLISEMDIFKLKVPDLKRELKLRGLSTSGNKNDLIERLRNALKSIDVSAESVDDLDDDLLNDDDLDQDHLDTSESVLNDLDNLDAPETNRASKRKISKTDMSDLDSKSSKRIVLNRSASVLSNSEKTNGSEPLPDVNTEKVQFSTKPDDETKVVKLSELSAKERLEMRAKKFGTPVSEDAKKVARAERFSGTVSAAIAPVLEPNMDALKKRAERFGGSVSKALSSVEQQERLKKRKERFGIVTTTNGTSQNGKAQQRLERFKTPVV